MDELEKKIVKTLMVVISLAFLIVVGVVFVLWNLFKDFVHTIQNL